MKGGKKRTRKMRGGMGYGFGGTIGTAGAQWDSSWGGEVTKAGAPVYDSADPKRGGSRHRKQTKKLKNKQKNKRRTTRKMRGGAQWQSAANVGYGYTGEGSRGLANATAYASKVPVGGPTQNPDGAYRP